MVKTSRRVDYAVKVAGFCVAYGLSPSDWKRLTTQLDETATRIKAWTSNPTPARRERMQSEVIRSAKLVRQHEFTIDWTQSGGVHDGTFTISCNGFVLPFPKY